MKRVGDILKEKRLEQGKTLEDLSKITKIRKYFLSAIEDGRYEDLPDMVYVKGFIQSYSQALGLDPEKVLPFYRREFAEEQKEYKETKELTSKPLITITFGKVFAVIVAVGLTIFLGILFTQYKQFSNAPILIVDSPSDQFSTEQKKISVFGTTDSGNIVTINGEEVRLSASGNFELSYTLEDGLNKIIISVENKLGKKTEITRTVEKVVLAPENNTPVSSPEIDPSNTPQP
ncbi:helix-turn-helix domain-containing protein [bacterium]|uniref:HTH cro/C1-type domain-containing protein n=2 Tax=Katanobacteria TaxID=422282 RepID=A0A2M7X3W3_UNCKA|nr:helix-turn-helix domain-containing protein [bacterium]PIP56259.1 MAG: hypothetical protein COX05_03935 [candidate division WWE3 bacterium CG22_combo_CG10-13_8_21_14_all_39_12]PJA40830.1 MAG: hypothetical protein CO179_01250 [candidate division WWE3 bacterium CG_4_9_14_3_um_filter_39_7]